MFTLIRQPRAKDWWMLKSREEKFISDLPSSIHGWKSRFFYVSFASDPSIAPWGFPTGWGTPRTSSNSDKNVSTSDQEDFDQLNSIEVPPLRVLMKETMLSDAGIGPGPRDTTMLSQSEIKRMFSKRPSGGAESSDQPKKKKKKITTGPPRRDQIENLPTESGTGGESIAIPPTEQRAPQATDKAAVEPQVPLPTSTPTQSASIDPHPTASTSQPGPTIITHGIQLDVSTSGITNAEVARQIINLSIAPLDEEIVTARSAGEALAQSYVGMIAVGQNLSLLDRTMASYRKSIRDLKNRSEKAEAGQKAAKESQKIAEEAIQSAADREKSLRDEIARLNTRLSREMEEKRKLLEALSGTQEVLSSTRAALKESESALALSQSESHINRLEAESVKENFRQAKKEIEAVKHSAAEAVDSYKKSAECKATMIESSKLFYITGFNSCKEEVIQNFPTLDLSMITEPVFNLATTEPESEESDEEPASEPTKALTTVPIEIPAAAEIVDLTEDIPSKMPTEKPTEEAPENLQTEDVSAKRLAEEEVANPPSEAAPIEEATQGR